MIYLGEKKVGSIYLGGKKLSKIYLGEKLVWEGYPEGHIIGTATEAGIRINISSYYTAGYVKEDPIFYSDSKKRFDMDFTAKGIGLNTMLFRYGGEVYSIDSFKVTISSYKIEWEIFYCPNLTRVNINGMKVQSSNVQKTFNTYAFIEGCDNLKYIKAGGVNWEQAESIGSTFSYLPSLLELDLSGANFNNTKINGTSFLEIGTVGTVVKVIGCSATTQNKILNALNTNNSRQTWVLNDGVITRTA